MNLTAYNRTKTYAGDLSLSAVVMLILLIVMSIATEARAIDLSTYALSDRQVLYLYDDPAAIDWGTIYFLNDYHYCEVKLLTVRPGGEFRLTSTNLEDRQLYSYTAYGSTDSTRFVSQLFRELFGSRRPDLVLIGELRDTQAFKPLTDYLLKLPTDTNAVFELQEIYRWLSSNDEAAGKSVVAVNDEELAARYRDRMRLEVTQLVPAASLDSYDPPRFARYELLKGSSSQSGGLLADIPSLRLLNLLDSYLGDGKVKTALLNQARNYITLFSMAQKSQGSKRVEQLVSGYKALTALVDQCQTVAHLRSKSQFTLYLDNLLERARRALLDEINISWSGRIIRRDSPHGPRLKFRASLAVDGPQEVELSYIRFHPYWDASVVTLEAVSRKVLPHQAFVREYLIDIDRSHLESRLPDSLLFTAEIVYSSLSLPVSSSMAVRDIPSLSISFEPSFHFVAPVARVDIDQVVSSMNWKAVISKPYDYAGTVSLSLETPRGVFAGAYKTTWELNKGRRYETLRIPFSVSNLFQEGIQTQTIRLMADGQVVDIDSGIIRIASCDVSEKVHIGLFPDTTGLLEDILRMTGAAYQPLTDRALVTADLDAYEVLVFGSGSFRKYPGLTSAKDRLEDYLRRGGSILIFGQPNDWPEGLLPVSLVPTRERTQAEQIKVRLPEGTIVTKPYAIEMDQLLAYFDRELIVFPAVISPSERVLVTSSGAALLSVSRLGEGQIIFCGLPLVEMISELNLQAIHLLANLLNYK